LVGCAEDHAAYEAVHYVMENSLKAAESRRSFGVDAPATVGEWPRAVCVVWRRPQRGGGSHAFWASTALCPRCRGGYGQTHGLNDNHGTFAQVAMGAELPAVATDENRDAAMTRGELAQYLMDVFEEE
jgi:hypothetical protein